MAKRSGILVGTTGVYFVASQLAAHGLHAGQPGVPLHGFGHQVGGVPHNPAKPYRPRYGGPCLRDGRDVLVPEVQLEHFRAGGDLSVVDAEGILCHIEAHPEKTIRIITELEDTRPSAEGSVDCKDDESHGKGSCRDLRKGAFTAQLPRADGS